MDGLVQFAPLTEETTSALPFITASWPLCSSFINQDHHLMNHNIYSHFFFFYVRVGNLKKWSLLYDLMCCFMGKKIDCFT